jgi:hypothetical protein
MAIDQKSWERRIKGRRALLEHEAGNVGVPRVSVLACIQALGAQRKASMHGIDAVQGALQ